MNNSYPEKETPPREWQWAGGAIPGGVDALPYREESLVRSQFPNKRVIVAYPPDRHSQRLRRAANVAFAIGEEKLRQNLLPSPITTGSGFAIRRPAEWY